MEEKNKVLLFLHIAKTAGTSFRKYVDTHFNKNEFKELYDSDVILQFMLSEKKEEINALFGHFSFKHRLDTYILPRQSKYITFLRNPVERVVSQFFHFKRSNMPGHIKMMRQHPNIKKFLQSQRGQNWQVQCVAGVNILQIKAHPKLCLDLAKYNINHFFDFVGITEEYEFSLKKLSEKYNWKTPVIEKRNVGKRPNTFDLSKELINNIKKENALDIELYNYALNLLKGK